MCVFSVHTMLVVIMAVLKGYWKCSQWFIQNKCCDCIVNNNCYHNVYRWKRENGIKAYAATVLWVITRISVVMGWFRIKLFTV